MRHRRKKFRGAGKPNIISDKSSLYIIFHTIHRYPIFFIGMLAFPAAIIIAVVIHFLRISYIPELSAWEIISFFIVLLMITGSIVVISVVPGLIVREAKKENHSFLRNLEVILGATLGILTAILFYLLVSNIFSFGIYLIFLVMIVMANMTIAGYKLKLTEPSNTLEMVGLGLILLFFSFLLLEVNSSITTVIFNKIGLGHYRASLFLAKDVCDELKRNIKDPYFHETCILSNACVVFHDKRYFLISLQKKESPALYAGNFLISPDEINGISRLDKQNICLK